MSEPSRDDVNRMVGPTVVEFGASWCGHCQATRATVKSLREKHPDIRYIQVEDGPGRPLGRSFHVKLWPTFVFLRDGKVIKHLVRPSANELVDAFEAEGK